MRSLKSGFGVFGALVPLFYCGSLIYTFVDISGSAQDAGTNGPGPMQLGLGAISLLFCIPLIIKVVRFFARTHAAVAGPAPASGDDQGGFDADAAIARYMAQRPAEAAPNVPAPRPARGGPARPTGFGRRIK